MQYTKEQLRVISQNKFNIEEWTRFLIDFIGAKTILKYPEQLELDPAEGVGYYLGQKKTNDNYEIGLFYIQTNSSVSNRRVGLRKVVAPYMRFACDAALAVFDDGSNWRLSFICDIKGEQTSPKRYTFVFGERENYYHTAVSRFIDLQSKEVNFANLKDAFSVEVLTKQFYKDLFKWYQWAISPDSGITFPNNTSIEGDDRDDIETKIIRMITRIMFVWFIKQKQLVPDKLFDDKFIGSILRNFDPQSPTDGNYYNAILQNLFFATLNREIMDEDGNGRTFATASNQRDVKNLYRYAEMFAINEQEVIDLFAGVPFLNGGLFECLDKTKRLDGVEQPYNFDGFSRNDLRFADGRFKHRAVVPNILFFEPEGGLISILSRYNFTIEENTPEEQQVALDPELLGKVFENLLAAYTPESPESVRKSTGSYYTPTEVVRYMVDESLIAYLGDTLLVRSLFRYNFTPDPAKSTEYQEIADKLKAVKVLDPACGSGAFPMGLLNRMVDVLERISPDEHVYDLKLKIIENCLYGSDIQSIAAQITKLRFFISLICDCEKDASKPNFGMPTLPNLETKFVAANTLIEMKRTREQFLFKTKIEPVKKDLEAVRHKHFSAKSTSEKRTLRENDRKLREKLAKLLADENNFAPEDAHQLAAWNPYDQNAVSPFFDPEWMFGIADGFDIVIGNPPYVSFQKPEGRRHKNLYASRGFATYEGSGDLYSLFYERGWQMLKPNGYLCFITSNKWMRSKYGGKTRSFLGRNTNPVLLIDFAGVKVFESATVDTNILLFCKAKNRGKTICAVTNKEQKDCLNNLSDFVQREQVTCRFDSADGWVVLTPIEQSIKRKIEAVGKPLKDWDINIYRGVLTGCNEAFIINTDKRDEILSNCQSEEERTRTEALIRPILRGRDIKRYGYDWAGLWLIFIPWHFPYQFDTSIQGASKRAEYAFIEQYPAVYLHLLQYKNQLLKRNKAETGIRYEWYALQRWGAKYREDFSKPKIVWNRIASEKVFAVVDKGIFIQDSMHFFTGNNLEYLNIVLNSKLYAMLLGLYIGEAAGGNAGNSDNVRDLYVAYPTSEVKSTLLQLFSEGNLDAVNEFIYCIYGLTVEEQCYIETYHRELSRPDESL